MEDHLSALAGTVVVSPDRAGSVQALTTWLADVVDARIAASGRCTVALSGGSSPIALFEAWRSETMASQLQLDRWWVGMVDERAVPETDPASNAAMLRRELIAPLGSAAPTFVAMEGGARDLDEAARRYAAVLDEILDHDGDGHPVFDVVLCGLGDDGHTASLFPGATSLDVEDRSVVASVAPVAPFQRLTLTFPTLNAARHLAVFAPGATRVDALVATAEGRTPAARLSGADLRWYVEVSAEA